MMLIGLLTHYHKSSTNCFTLCRSFILWNRKKQSLFLILISRLSIILWKLLGVRPKSHNVPYRLVMGRLISI